jgi:hypothetical protein
LRGIVIDIVTKRRHLLTSDSVMKQIYTNLCIVCGRLVHFLCVFCQLVGHRLERAGVE